MSAPSTDPSAMDGLAQRQLRWAGAASLAVALVSVLPPMPTTWAQAATFVAAASLTASRRGALLACLAVPLAAWGANALDLSPALGASAAAGAIATATAPYPTDRWDPWIAALACVATTGLTAWLSSGQIWWVSSVWMAVASSLALLPAAWRHDHPDAPSYFAGMSLSPDAWRAVRQARTLYIDAAKLAPDVRTRRGLRQVAGWVLTLHQTRDALDAELDRSDVPWVPVPTDHADPTVRDRLRATQRHHEARMALRKTVSDERDRTQAAAEHAIAWLEHARAGLALLRVHPHLQAPPDLDSMLAQIRTHTLHDMATRQTHWDMSSPVA